MLQRLVQQEVLARVFGILDALSVGAILLGSSIAPAINDLWGLRTSLVVVGAVLPVLALMGVPKLRSLSQAARSSMEDLAPRVELLERMGIFTGARRSLEALAATL